MNENKKRIELHCHSKYGGKAAMYPGEIIKYLSEQGMSAFAITDESSIESFTEIERVWQTGNYTSRPIYGMEIMVKGVNDGDIDHMSVLIKNEQGKKMIYKLISENENLEPHPLFEFEDFIANREGLLLGSGNANGRLYKLVKKGLPDKALKKVISIYDYIEVLPGPQFEEINKIIIAECEELKIPVIAISDARYCDELGQTVLKIMRHWNNENEDVEDNHFWTTEEMLDAFSYLPQEKAYEIVVENTHLIADMCEMVSIRPKERYYPTIPSARDKLRKRCYTALEEKYPDNDEARFRLDWELSAIEKTGMESYVVQIDDLLKMSNLKAEDIWLRGVGAGSMVLYLLGITYIDPLLYGLEPELILGIDGHRELDIDINIPSKMHSDVVDNFGKVEGIGKYVWAGTISGISYQEAQTMIDRYVEDMGILCDEEINNKLRWLIEGNFLKRGRHPGGIVVLPRECDYIELTPITKLAGGFETTYFEYHTVDCALVKYDLIRHDLPDILINLSGMTGVELKTIPVDSAEVLALFEENSDGNVPGCEGLPEFKSEQIRKIIAELHPNNFNDLVRISSVMHGTGTWEGNGKILVEEKGIDFNEIITTRDDVFEYILSLGLDRNTAFEIAEAVRKGIVSRGKNSKWQHWKKELIAAGAPEWYVWSCEQIRYLCPRAYVISYMCMNMRLGWFKVHYPNEFNKVLKEYEESV